MANSALLNQILYYTESATGIVIFLCALAIKCTDSRNMTHGIVITIAVIRLLTQAVLAIAFESNHAPYFHSIFVPMYDYITMTIMDFITKSRAMRLMQEQCPQLLRASREMLGVFCFSIGICVFVALHDHQYLLGSKQPLRTYSMLNNYYVFVATLVETLFIHVRINKMKEEFSVLQQFYKNYKIKALIQANDESQKSLLQLLYINIGTGFFCHAMLSVATILFILSYGYDDVEQFLKVHIPGRVLHVVFLTAFMLLDPQKLLLNKRKAIQQRRDSRALSDETVKATDNPTNAVSDPQQDM